MLFDHFMGEFQSIGAVTVHPHKTMITVMRENVRIAYITGVGKNFIHVIFSFKQRYDDNLCFQRIQEVVGRRVIYHHFRMMIDDDKR